MHSFCTSRQTAITICSVYRRSRMKFEPESHGGSSYYNRLKPSMAMTTALKAQLHSIVDSQLTLISDGSTSGLPLTWQNKPRDFNRQIKVIPKYSRLGQVKFPPISRTSGEYWRLYYGTKVWLKLHAVPDYTHTRAETTEIFVILPLKIPATFGEVPCHIRRRSCEKNSREVAPIHASVSPVCWAN